MSKQKIQKKYNDASLKENTNRNINFKVQDKITSYSISNRTTDCCTLINKECFFSHFLISKLQVLDENLFPEDIDETNINSLHNDVSNILFFPFPPIHHVKKTDTQISQFILD